MLHKNIALGENHRLHNYEYTDETTRLAASGFISADVGKVAWQKDNDTFWLLKNNSPVTWTSLSKSSGSTIVTTFSTRTVTTDAIVTAEDYTIRCNCLSNDITVNLPTASTIVGSVFVIKKTANTSYRVVIDPASTEVIDGSTTATINVYNQSLMLQSNGTSWDIL